MSATRDFRELIAGDWVKMFDDIDPYNGDVVARVPAGRREDARRAIDAASAGGEAVGACYRATLLTDVAPDSEFKDRGWGRFGGTAAMHEFTELRWVTVQSGTRPFPF